ncbi:conserved hypothetical protein [Bradyrhizobium sp. ORS 278]|uniref:DUF2783 domain-containing protein n=1 Tax=Bradyrhizobium sp. (strain ORS 278) TaxID=114615 RepID=UPI0001507FB9|nr:DUF2783 domain-containing protein [Bradyrhizobium sp. ORS 278]CAL79937.1 conserved hypothetical protein [Bradyrhizobium sp. ORS 278]
MSLTLTPNISDPDDFYAELIGSQRELSEDEALRMNARLVLLLANHVGDRATLSEAIRLARTPGG